VGECRHAADRSRSDDDDVEVRFAVLQVLDPIAVRGRTSPGGGGGTDA
jgi:hypothetical protein